MQKLIPAHSEVNKNAPRKTISDMNIFPSIYEQRKITLLHKQKWLHILRRALL